VISRLAVQGYRSVRDLTMELGPVTVILGENGTGKSNLYHAVKLLQHAAMGRLSRALADEGGMPSVLWAGARDRGAVRLVIEAKVDDWTYHLALGLPQAQGGAFPTKFLLDPEVKEERLELPVPKRKRPLLLLERGRASVTLRDEQGAADTFPFQLAMGESVLSQLSDPRRYPELYTLREIFLRWRFVHQFRTDPEAPARQPAVPVRTWRLAEDARDLPCALQTVVENGQDQLLDELVEQAFPGCRLYVEDIGGRLALAWSSPGLRRPLSGQELSDGTLRYLCLAAALLSPQPPPLLALNEPESSLHPSVLPALARLCAYAAKRSQLWVTTHSAELARELEAQMPLTLVHLVKEGGATELAG
jgi:predicted ATPase